MCIVWSPAGSFFFALSLTAQGYESGIETKGADTKECLDLSCSGLPSCGGNLVRQA